MQASSWITFLRNSKHSVFRRSSCKTGAAKWFEITWSTPNESLKPRCRSDAVRRLVPAKTSMAKSPCDVLPVHLADNLASKDANGPGSDCGSHEWLGKPWGLWHPGSAHTWTPLLHWPPAAASVHPVGKLYGQQIQRPSGVSKDLPTRSRGTLGPRPRLVLDFLLPFPFRPPWPLEVDVSFPAGGLVSSCLRLFWLFGFAFGAGFAGTCVARGNKWKLTLGRTKTFIKCTSKGRSPLASLLREVMTSAKCKKAALSARKTCTTVVLEYPGGESSCKWLRCSAWYEFIISYEAMPTKSNAKARRRSAWTSSSSVLVAQVWSAGRSLMVSDSLSRASCFNGFFCDNSKRLVTKRSGCR